MRARQPSPRAASRRTRADHRRSPCRGDGAPRAGRGGRSRRSASGGAACTPRLEQGAVVLDGADGGLARGEIVEGALATGGADAGAQLGVAEGAEEGGGQ